MPDKLPHISVPLSRLAPRMLGLRPEQLEAWPEDVRELATMLASELFLVTYNPYINPDDVRESVQRRLEEAKSLVPADYVGPLSGAIKGFWREFDADMEVKRKALVRLRELMNPMSVVDSPEALIQCSTDATDLRMEMPIAVAYPETIAQVQAIVALAGELGFHIVPRGGGSGLTGGAVPSARKILVLSLVKLGCIPVVDPVEKRICIQSGVLTIDAIRAAAAKDMLFTVDPASKQASSIGGNVSENAGGPYAFEYGTTLDNILSYTMVLPDASIIEVKRRNHPRHKILPEETAIFDICRENGEVIDTITLSGGDIRGTGLGKDVSNKFLGGLPGIQKEGVDGVVVEACFVLHDKPKLSRTLCLEFYGRTMHNAMLVIQGVVALRDRIRSEGDKVKISSLEEFNSKYVQAIDYAKKSARFEGDPISVLLLMLDSDDEEALSRSVADVVDICQAYDNVEVFVAENEKQADLYWEDRHKLSAIAKRTSGFKINEDIVIPLSQVPTFADFLETLNLQYMALAYRRALQELSQLPGISPADEFISMEMQFAASILRGEVGFKDLSDQELEVQAAFFFQDLLSRYPKLGREFERLHKELLARRIIVASHMHAGDGNCHVNIPVNSNDTEMLRQAHEAAEKVFEKVTELGGAVSGEHGIGITKIAFLGEDKIKALAAYKKIIDPKNIFNPGKLVRRELPLEPYTFSFNRLIRDLGKTALPDRDRLITLLRSIQSCTRCGKCKQVCAFFQPQRGLIAHPRNKNIALGALIEAVYFSWVHHGRPSPELLDRLRQLTEHCTACGKCVGACPVKLPTPEAMLGLRAFVEDKGAGGHPIKAKVMQYLVADIGKRTPQAAKAAAWGQTMANRVVGLLPGGVRERFDSPLLRGAGPITGFKNLAETLKLETGSIFVPRVRDESAGVAFYFPGCGASLFYRHIGLAALHLLLRAGVPVVMPARHACCGYPLLAAGLEDAWRRNRSRNTEALSELFVRAMHYGLTPTVALTSCGTCREALSTYELATLAGGDIDQLDVEQYLLERFPAVGPKGTPAPERILYHAACHSEWTGLPPAKATAAYRDSLASLTHADVAISPGCCAESGMGAMTSPKLYNKIRAKKIDQLTRDLDGAATDMPVVVGCPSCKIGIKRSLMAMGKKQPVLHTLELLANMIDGPKWRKILLRNLDSEVIRKG